MCNKLALNCDIKFRTKYKRENTLWRVQTCASLPQHIEYTFYSSKLHLQVSLLLVLYYILDHMDI
jgi:hypothetical protein